LVILHYIFFRVTLVLPTFVAKTSRVLSIDPGTKHLSLCILERGGRIAYWNTLELGGQTGRAQDVIDALRQTPGEISYDTVLIERQPPRNIRMKKMESMLEMYFVMSGKAVSVVDSKRKLRYASETPYWQNLGDISTTYTLRKKQAVATVEAFLGQTNISSSHDSESLTKFYAAKKKDDFADCLLQAQAHFYYQNNKK
jgi:hypothetical protein